MSRDKMNFVPGDKPYSELDAETTTHVIFTERISQYCTDHSDSDKISDKQPYQPKSSLSDSSTTIMDKVDFSNSAPVGQVRESYVLLEKITVTTDMVPPVPITPVVNLEEDVIVEQQPHAQETEDNTSTVTEHEDEISMIREFLDSYPDMDSDAMGARAELSSRGHDWGQQSGTGGRYGA